MARAQSRHPGQSDKHPGPRDNPRYKPRGLKRWTYTWQTIADLLGVSLHTARKYGQGRGRKFNPADLASVVRFYEERRGKG